MGWLFLYTADCKSLAISKMNGGKPQLIYHVWIWLSFPRPSSWFKHSKSIVVFHCSICLLQDFCNILYTFCNCLLSCLQYTYCTPYLAVLCNTMSYRTFCMKQIMVLYPGPSPIPNICTGHIYTESAVWNMNNYPNEKYYNSGAKAKTGDGRQISIWHTLFEHDPLG